MAGPVQNHHGRENEKANNNTKTASAVERLRDVDLIDVILGHIPGLRSFFDLKERSFNLEPRHLYNGLPLPDELLDPKSGYPRAKYTSNKVRSSKYTPLNFLPKNVLFQFKNIANVYFLIVAILSAFTIFGVDNGAVGAIPIIAIIAITAIRDAIEDSRRFIQDSELNNNITYRLHGFTNPNVVAVDISSWRKFKKSCTSVLTWLWHLVFSKRRASTRRSNMQKQQSQRISMETQDNSAIKFKRDYWKNVQVGDFLKIYADDPVPADVVVLSTNEPDNTCFIETRNLDGEANLKPRQGLKMTDHLEHGADCAQEKFWMDIEGASGNLQSFGWNIHGPDGTTEAMTNDNLIPRGSTLRITKWVIGYVVYTGFETKLQLNAGETPTKRSRFTRDLNFYIYISFFYLFALSIVGGLVEGLKFRSKKSSAHYFEFGFVAGSPAMNGFVNFFATMVLIQDIIPIALYISIEITRTIQVFFIWSDVQIYDEETDYPCTPKSWSISDDLGQIEFIFSDKTGTLTQNSMVFRKMTINGKSYGLAFTEVLAGKAIARGENPEEARIQAKISMDAEKERMLNLMPTYYANPFIEAENVQLVSADIYSDLMGASGPQQQQAAHYFMLGLALCNTVVIEMMNGKLVHQAESPDEAALVSTANDLGYTLTDAQKGTKTLNIRGEVVEYEVLATVMFTSTRKRMSILLKDQDGKTFVLTKGADNMMETRLGKTTPESKSLVETTMGQLDGYGDEGLRTLVFGYKEVDTEWAYGWKERYSQAGVSPDRDILLEEVAEELESDLCLIGGSAIEDQLQLGVPHTIKVLGQAGIKIWMLTGDKMETAISIGYACNLVEPGMRLLMVTEPLQLTSYLHELGLQGTDEEVRIASNDHRPANGHFALVIDGPTIDAISDDPLLSRHFALVGKKCKSVICCRLSPFQKAVVVSIMKRTFDVTTLAIGDGANDVSMIQQADIGVGIVGAEGRQAAMSSDFAIGKFRFLERLVLVHGRWSYMRIANLTANLLYKNVVFTMTLFWYGIHNQFDNTYVFDYSYVVLFESIFTSLPVIFMGCLDQDIPDTVAQAVPQLYAKGILRQEWTKKKFFIYCADGLYQSIICYFFAYLCFYDGGFVTEEGTQINYRPGFGVFVATSAIVTCNLYVLVNLHRWDWLSVFIIFLSCGLLFAWTGIYTSFTSSQEFYKAAVEVYGSLAFWAETLLSIICSILPRISYLAMVTNFFPTDTDIAREQFITGEIDVKNLWFPTTEVHEGQSTDDHLKENTTKLSHGSHQSLSMSSSAPVSQV